MSPDPLPVDIVVRGFPDLPPDRPAKCHPWPERALLVDACSARPRGGGLTWGAYLLDGPDPEPIAGRFFDARLVGAEEVKRARGEVMNGAGFLDRDEFLDLVFRSVYKLPMRAALVCWDLGFVISRLARSVRVVRRDDGSEVFRFVWWTYLDPEGKERTDFYRPRIDVATADAGRLLVRFTRRKKPDPQDLVPEGRSRPRTGYVYPGRFLGLSTAVYALSGQELSFADACRAFDVMPPTGPEHTPDTLQERMNALSELYRAVIAEFRLHPGAPYLGPDHALSPSSVGKAYMRSLGVSSPLRRNPRQSRRALGAAMSAYVGPRSEVRVRRVTQPVAYIDAHSMFLLIDVLMGLSELLTHRVQVRRYRTKRDLRELRGRLESMDRDSLLFRPDLWRLLRGVALVDPQEDWLPTKAAYSASDEETTAVSPVVSSRDPVWVSFASLVESMLRTGRLPRLIEAYEWVPEERLPGLGRVRIRETGALIDLTEGPLKGAFTDPFQALAAERARLRGDTSLSEPARERIRGLLKVMGVSVGYGAEVEFNRRGMPIPLRVWGPLGPLEVEARPEHPGWLCYPPFATTCVAGSRLMMALIECLVKDAGSGFLWMDTDGGCIGVSKSGGLVRCPGGPFKDSEGRECVRALSFSELQGIRERFRPLAEAVGFISEDPGGVLSVFKLEDHNLGGDGRFDGGLECQAVSVKNYVLLRRNNEGNPIRDPRSKFSAHAMGNLLSPIDPESGDPSWIPESWLWRIAEEEERDVAEPEWLDRVPVMHELVVAHPDDFRMIGRLNHGLGYAEGTMPFDTLLVAHRDRFMAREDDPTQLLAAWNADPRVWTGLEYRDPQTGRSYRIAMRVKVGTYRGWQRKKGVVYVESMRSYLEKHFTHPEPAATDPHGQQCLRETRGFLLAQPIRIRKQIVVGKDTNRLRERRVGWRSGKEERQAFTRVPDLIEVVLPILADASDRWLRGSGIEPRTVRKARERNGERTSLILASRLADAATNLAREALKVWGVSAGISPAAAMAIYLEERNARGAYRAESSSCRGCGSRLSGRQMDWCESCRGLPGRERARVRKPRGKRPGPTGRRGRRAPMKSTSAAMTPNPSTSPA